MYCTVLHLTLMFFSCFDGEICKTTFTFSSTCFQAIVINIVFGLTEQSRIPLENLEVST